MDPFVGGSLITAGGNFLSNLFSGGANRRAAKYQADATKHAADQQLAGIEKQLEFDRKAAEMKQKGTELENMRRSQEAMARAAKLEDVAGMLGGLEMPGAFSGGISSLGSLLGAGSGAANMDFSSLGGISAALMNNPELANILSSAEGLDPDMLRQLIGQGSDVSDIRRMAGSVEDVSGLESIAASLMSADDSADLRTSAMRELSRGGDTMAALMAQQGVRGSGFAAGQQREMGAEVFSNLAERIASSRRENLLGSAGVMGQIGSQRGLAGQLYGQAGSQTLGAGNLAASLATIEQGNVGMRSDIAQAMNRQTASAADILANQYNLQLQGQGINVQALSAAAGAEASLAGTQASYELGRGRMNLEQQMGIADIYRDEAFGANLEYNPFEFAELYDQMERDYNAKRDGGTSNAELMDILSGRSRRPNDLVVYPGGTKDFYNNPGNGLRYAGGSPNFYSNRGV